MRTRTVSLFEVCLFWLAKRYIVSPCPVSSLRGFLVLKKRHFYAAPVLMHGCYSFHSHPRIPKSPPHPIRKPKSYQAPLLCTSYTVTRSEKMEPMKVKKQIVPCQRPSQNPARSPNCGSGTSSRGLVLGAHPVIKSKAKMSIESSKILRDM